MRAEKKEISYRRSMVNGGLYALCAAILFYRGAVREFDLMFLLLGLVWLSGAVIWAVRAERARRRDAADRVKPQKGE